MVAQPPARRSFLGKALDFYHTKLEYNTIRRCPFLITCSNFAYMQIEKRGLLLGTLYFIDRHYYRENFDAFAIYPMKQNSEGIYKLDDNFYVEN